MKWNCKNELFQSKQSLQGHALRSESVFNTESFGGFVFRFIAGIAGFLSLLGLTGCSLEAGILSSVFEEKIQVQLQSVVAPQNNLSVIPITVIFSENVADLSLGDFAVVNGTISDLVKGADANAYYLNVHPTRDGLVTVVFSAKTVKLEGGDEYRRTVAGEISFVVNRTEASVSIAGPSKLYVNSEKSVEFTLNFSGVTEVEADLAPYLSLIKTGTADCTMSLVSISQLEKKVVLSSCSGDGAIHLALASGSASGVNGPTAGVESSYALTVDTTAPKLTIANPTPLLGSKAHTFRWTVTLSDSSLDLSGLLSSLEWAGDTTGCVFSATGSGVSRVVQATSCEGTTELSFSIPEGHIVDLAGNKSAQVSSVLVKVDNAGPSAPTSVSLGVVPENLTSTPTITFTGGVDVGGSTTSKNYIRILQGTSVIRDWVVFTSGQAFATGLSLVKTTEYEVQIRSDDALGNKGATVSATWTSMTPNCIKGTTQAGDVCDGGARYLGAASDIVNTENILSRFMITPSGCGEIPADKIAGGSGATAYSFGEFESTCSGVDVKKAWSNGKSFNHPDLFNASTYTDDRYGDENTRALSLNYKDSEMGISAAARYCQNLVYGGYDDWYLPSINESKLFNNIRTANVVPLGVKFSTSSEYSESYTYTFELTSSGYSRGSAGKTNSGDYLVRCIRRIGPMAPKNLSLQGDGATTETPKVFYDNAIAEVGFPVQSYEVRLIKKETRAIVKAWSPHVSGDAIPGLSLETGAYIISVRAVDAAGNRGKISSTEWIYQVDCSNLNTTLAGTYCDSGVIYAGKLAPGAESGGASVDHYMVTPGGCEPTPDSVRVGSIGVWAYPSGRFTPQCDHVLDQNLVRWSNQTFDIPDIFGYENSQGTGFGLINKDLQYGSVNTNFIVFYASSSRYYPAAQYCANLDYGGFSDWFLPNRYELNLLYTNRSKINGLEKKKSGFEGRYLSSTEAPPRDEMVWMQDMSYGEQSAHWKESRDTLFRCMRRVSTP